MRFLKSLLQRTVKPFGVPRQSRGFTTALLRLLMSSPVYPWFSSWRLIPVETALRLYGPTTPKCDPASAPQRPPRSLGSFVAGFKSASTKSINQIRHTPGLPFWQRNYYEHIIRSQEAWNRLRQYIASKPLEWEQDVENQSGDERV
jgi:hypothetical protein